MTTSTQHTMQYVPTAATTAFLGSTRADALEDSMH
jgi:hypothetical protein